MIADLNETELKKLVPVGRFGDAEEVAALVAFWFQMKLLILPVR